MFKIKDILYQRLVNIKNDNICQKCICDITIKLILFKQLEKIFVIFSSLLKSIGRFT